MYAPPLRPYQIYSQGFWYAISAAAFYLLCSILLMINMFGFFLGHYPDTFALSESQRILILQTRFFFVWIARGAAVFSKIETDAGEGGWAFAVAMYFCDVTILTVGFGDLYPTTNLARGIISPYAVGGIITLAFIVSSIHKFIRQPGEENIVRKHIERMQKSIVEHAATNSSDLHQRKHKEHHLIRRRTFEKRERPGISASSHPRTMRKDMGYAVESTTPPASIIPILKPLQKICKPLIMLTMEVKDQFVAVRDIQSRLKKFKKWIALVFSVTTYGIL